MINVSDVTALIIIVGFSLLGFSKGFMLSLFRLISFFVSYFGSIMFYPAVANILYKTQLYVKIKMVILNNIMLKQQEGSLLPIQNSPSSNAYDIVNNIKLPDFLQSSLLNKVSNLLDTTSIIETASSYLTKVIIDTISIVVLFILIRFILMFARIIIRKVARIPIIKQADKIGGFAFGLIEGIVTVVIIVQILLIFDSLPFFERIVNIIDTSLLAKYFKVQFILNNIL